MSGRQQFERGRAARPAPGVPAKKRRGDIAESWWSKRFVSVLEGLTVANRLTRGRAYARGGQVIGLTVRSAWVTAQVQGSGHRPYDVWIQVSRLSEAEWDRVEDAMAGHAHLAAALLVGEMLPEIEVVFASAGLSLFPSSQRDLAMECSCPDRANPCKHVAASFYMLAEAFDRDPFLLFQCRGRSRDALLAGLRRRRGEVGNAETSVGGDASSLPLSLADFWGDDRVDELSFEPVVAEVPEALLCALEPAPVHPDGSSVTTLLVATYRELGAAEDLLDRSTRQGGGLPAGTGADASQSHIAVSSRPFIAEG